VDVERQPAEVWLARVKDLERKHELLRAFDVARRGVAQHPDALWLKHRGVLCLLRLGAARSARTLFRAYELEGRPEEDIAVLPARIAKEEAMEASPRDRVKLAREAAVLYEAVFRSSHGTYYSGINAATMRLLACEVDEARALASEVLRLLHPANPKSDPYYLPATRAEALLLLGDRVGAATAISEAAGASVDLAARVATYRQLKAICAELGEKDRALLAPISPPAVIHYTGHMISPSDCAGRFPAATEHEVAERIAQALEEFGVGSGYGALACGADILFAEAIIARGAELHVVLPFAQSDFENHSVAPGGAGWLTRFHACLRRASSVTYASSEPYLGGDAIYAFASGFAMGLAILQARSLDAAVAQIAVSDGSNQAGIAGTARDRETWRAAGLPSHEIPVARLAEGLPLPSAEKPEPVQDARQPRAMLFGDIEGFSKLAETQIPLFTRVVMGTIAQNLDRFGAHVLYRNTWGDGISLVFDSAQQAAACAVALQDELRGLDLESHALPRTIGLRLGGHYGLVYEITDPVTKRRAFTGSQVSRTARIEPITPKGEVYVTDVFAAHLALKASDEFKCDYVGHLPAAKDWGEMPMYLVRRLGAR
jgi:class 3 adenylate cyclase